MQTDTYSSRAHFRPKCRQTAAQGLEHILDQSADRHLQFESTFQTKVQTGFDSRLGAHFRPKCRQALLAREHISDQSADRQRLTAWSTFQTKICIHLLTAWRRLHTKVKTGTCSLKDVSDQSEETYLLTAWSTLQIKLKEELQLKAHLRT